MRRPTIQSAIPSICFILLAAGVSHAAKPGKSKAKGTVKAAATTGSPSGLMLLPGNFSLQGPRARQQVIVTGQYGSNVVAI